MRIVTQEQRQRLADADEALQSAVDHYYQLIGETTDAREALYRAIYDLYRAGLSQHDIADLLGKTREHIRRVCEQVAKQGDADRHPHPRLVDAEEAVQDAAVRYDRLNTELTDVREVLYQAVFDAEQAGMRQRDIVHKTGWTREHIRRVCEKIAKKVAAADTIAHPLAG